MKKAASESSVDSQSASEPLPPGWTRVALGNLGLGRTEGIEPAEEPDTLFELWSVPSFPTGKPEKVLGSTIGSNKQRVTEGDVLLCKINPRINRVWRVGPASGLPQIASTEWIVFRSPAFDPAFLMWRFRENKFRAALCANMTGVGGSLTRARPKDVAQIEIALPPLPEQRRIVARLEALEARSRRAREKLAAVPAQLAQARQSLLAAAFRGDLTADWRSKARVAQSGCDLLSELNRLHEASPAKKGNAAQATEGVHELDSKSLPSTWAVAELRTLCHPDRPICYGILMPGPELKEGVPYVRVADFPKDRIRLETVRNTSPEIDAKFARSRLSTGDILLSIRGTVGRLAVVPPELEGANITQDTARLSIHPSVSSEFVLFMLRSPDTLLRMQSAVKGVAVRGINIGDVRPLQIPLPPLPEQHEIVRRLSAAFARLDAAAAAHAATVAELDRLDQSLLARAFSGEMVTQSLDDEPACVTLKGLSGLRAEAPKLKKERRPRGAASIEPDPKLAMPKSRFDSDVKGQPYLANLLRNITKEPTVEELLKKSDLPLVDFYKQLDWEVRNGKIRNDTKKLEPVE